MHDIRLRKYDQARFLMGRFTIRGGLYVNAVRIGMSSPNHGLLEVR